MKNLIFFYESYKSVKLSDLRSSRMEVFYEIFRENSNADLVNTL